MQQQQQQQQPTTTTTTTTTTTALDSLGEKQTVTVAHGDLHYRETLESVHQLGLRRSARRADFLPIPAVAIEWGHQHQHQHRKEQSTISERRGETSGNQSGHRPVVLLSMVQAKRLPPQPIHYTQPLNAALVVCVGGFFSEWLCFTAGGLVA